MRPRPTRLCGFVSVCVSFFVVFFTSAALYGETSAQPSEVPPRIVQPVDDHRLTVLKGNTHRLARPQFDQGPAPPDLPMERMLLVLKRSPEQDSALHKLLDDQQDKFEFYIGLGQAF